MIKKHAHSFGIILILALSTIVVAGIVVLLATRPNPIEAPVMPAANQPAQPSESGDSENITFNNLVQGQNVSMPMTVTGTVKGGWFFEGSFPVFLRDANNNQIGIGLATTTEDWMTSSPLPFTVILPDVAYMGPGTIVFTKDNPSGLPEHDESYTVQVMYQ